MKIIDYTIYENQRFGKLTVLGMDALTKRAYFVCRCDCGRYISLPTRDINKRKTTSCKFCRAERDSKNYEGFRSNKLVALERTAIVVSKHRMYIALCDCGQYTLVSINAILNHNTKSCGCVAANRIYAGENNPNWQGGKTSENNLIRSSDAYSEWRKAVKARDSYICKKCSCNENLEVHHIENFARNEDVRMDINNGMTLCELCHTEIHHIYGCYTNAQELYEWLYTKGD